MRMKETDGSVLTLCFDMCHRLLSMLPCKVHLCC